MTRILKPFFSGKIEVESCIMCDADRSITVRACNTCTKICKELQESPLPWDLESMGRSIYYNLLRVRPGYQVDLNKKKSRVDVVYKGEVVVRIEVKLNN